MQMVTMQISTLKYSAKLESELSKAWFKPKAKVYHGNVTHFNYTLRWERKFNVIWIKE